MSDHSRIQQWVESVAGSSSRRSASPDDFLHPYNTQEPFEDEEPEHGDNLKAQQWLVHQLMRRNDDIDESEPKITQPALRNLETPILFESFKLPDVLEKEGFHQVKELHTSIVKHQGHRRNIVPNEIREHFITLYKQPRGYEPSEHIFRKDPMPSEVVDSNPRIPATMHAEMEFQKLQVIHRQAQRSRLNHRHEAGWIAHVYLQLIDHVFEGVGQYENIQGATMEGDSIPFKKYRRNLGRGVPDGLDTSSEFCVSVSESSASSANSVPRGNKDPRKLAHIQSRGGVKIVDFALLLDVQKNSALPDTIDSLIRTVCRDGRYHLNQTAYEPIASRLIAVSIRVEEPFSGVDPLPPLALWTAAWYKRMRALRRELFATKIASIKDENTRQELRKQEQQKNLITVPVITVVGHQWEIYYAFFDAESITIYGPVELGSTCSLLDLYALVASLRTIKEWIQTTFREAMGEWFMVEANTADA